jgi:hypothetical protein
VIPKKKKKKRGREMRRATVKINKSRYAFA